LAKDKVVPLRGSEKKAVTGATEIGSVDPKERIEITIIARPDESSKTTSAEVLGRLPVSKRAHVSREKFAASCRASQDNIGKIVKFAKDNSLEIIEVNPARRSIILSGLASQFCEIFQVELKRFKHPSRNGIFRGRSGPLFLPESLSSAVLAILGLDDRPQAGTHFRLLRPSLKVISSYTPPQLARIYDFPPGLDGSGECIGIIELGGGETQSDLSTYFQKLGLTPPKVTIVSVDHGANAPTGDPNGPDGEVMLDIEVAGSVAPGVTIAMYFAPNTDRGFVDALTTAINDSQNKPSVISISWGSPENSWTSQAIQSLNQALQDAATLGVTVCCASGDGGSSDGATDGLAHVDFPASSPYAIGCGGTRILPTSNGRVTESVWNDEPQGGATGGGVSDLFALPSWQDSSKVPPSANPGGRIGRGVPDICADADPATGYAIRVDGKDTVFGGTSAVAPLWSGLIALLNQKLGRSLGYINPLLYEKLSSPGLGDFHDVTAGNNGAYSAAAGWDPCTGLGSPDGAKLMNSILTS